MPQIEIIEADENGGFDISADVPVVAEDPQLNDFISSPRFSGPRPGFVFKTDTRGTGYYRDVNPRISSESRRPGARETTAAAPKPLPPPSAITLELLHRRAPLTGAGAGAEGVANAGEKAPHSVEVRVALGAAEYADVKASAFKVAVVAPVAADAAGRTRGGAGVVCRLTAPGCWAKDQCLEVPVGYPLAVERAQGWLHDGTLTLRLPITA